MLAHAQEHHHNNCSLGPGRPAIAASGGHVAQCSEKQLTSKDAKKYYDADSLMQICFALDRMFALVLTVREGDVGSYACATTNARRYGLGGELNFAGKSRS